MKLPMLSVLIVTALTMACGGKYSDVIAVNKAFAGHLEVCAQELEKADDAKHAAKALNKLADKLENLSPKMRRLAEKYPELNDGDAKNHPALQASQKDVETVSQRFGSSMMKAMRYRDKEVKKAQERVSRAMMMTQ